MTDDESRGTWTHLKILNNVPYSRVASDFNPTLKIDGRMIPYDSKRSEVMIGGLNAYKFVSFNSSITISNLYLNESGITVFNSDGCLFQILYSPFKHLTIMNSALHIQDPIVYSGYAPNIILESLVIDIGPSVTIMIVAAIDNCLYYTVPGLGSSVKMNNLTFTGYGNTAQANRAFIFLYPMNVTFTNSLVVDFVWH